MVGEEGGVGFKETPPWFKTKRYFFVLKRCIFHVVSCKECFFSYIIAFIYADEVLWSNTWDEKVSGDTITVSLNNLQKEKEYDVRFTGTKINHAVVKVTFESELVQEKSRPSK